MTINNPKIHVTVLVPTKNEEANLSHCLGALQPAAKTYVIDSGSTDGTLEIASSFGAEVVQFRYEGGYPKKRQWSIEKLKFDTDWILLVDADEYFVPELWREIEEIVSSPKSHDAYMVNKSYHFLGKRFKYGGFSFWSVALFRRGKARFEKTVIDDPSGLDMEVHERIIVDGSTGRLKNPLLHKDFKGLEAYIDRHNRYSTWEANLRYKYLTECKYGTETITPSLFGNQQERRRFLKQIAVRLPMEPLLWFLYHYVVRLGFLEGRRGLIASLIRANYVSQVRSKVYELKQMRGDSRESGHEKC